MLVALAVAGTLAALLLPLLPVNQSVVTVRWPMERFGTEAVQAPFTGYQPVWFLAEIPCQSVRDLQARSTGPATLVDTTPPNAEYGYLSGLSVRLVDGQLSVFDKGRLLWRAPSPRRGCAVSINSDASRTTVSLGDRRVVDDAGDHRPLFTGIYSDLDARRDNTTGLDVRARADNRFDNVATPLKDTAIALSLLAVVTSLVLLRRLDRVRRAPGRWRWLRWWRWLRGLTGRDVTVAAVLTLWTVVGPVTSDDGYTLSMVQAREASGYIGNYFRWFDTPEAPFGWFYDLYAGWAQVSTATVWMRLPALLIGIGTWLLLSRALLPRLGERVATSRLATWSAAAAFVVFWLGYDHGLRPEPVVVLFSLLALCAVEHALAKGRLLPVAVALIAAGLSVAATPTGLIALLPFVVSAAPLVRLLRARIASAGALTTFAPLAAAGAGILVVVFYNQTLRALLEGVSSRNEIGPSVAWYKEPTRYLVLFGDTPDGSFARRFPLLLLVLCALTSLAVLIRRRWIPGTDTSASFRLIAISLLGLVVLAVTPTKWTHHFGAFAALGGALAGLTSVAIAPGVLRRWHRALFTAVLFLLAAAALEGPNTWWYISAWGVGSQPMPVTFAGIPLVTVALVCAGVAFAVAALEYLLRWRGVRPRRLAPGILRVLAAPLAVMCAALVGFELVTFTAVVPKRWDTYSLAGDNVRQVVGDGDCGLSDSLRVERNPLAGMLSPVQGQPGPGSSSGGFRRDGLPPSDPYDPARDWTPPYGMGGGDAPVWGSYPAETADFGSGWYRLPARARSGAVPLVVSMAGESVGKNAVRLEFGRRAGRGFRVVATVQPAEQLGAPGWRDARTTLTGAAASASAVRVVATDADPGRDGWLAVSAPRVPEVVSMTRLIGSSPSFVEWPAALVHPCLRPFQVRDGIAEPPEYLVGPGTLTRGMGLGQSEPLAGGPFGWLNSMAAVRKLPTYLRGDVSRDWGDLYAVDYRQAGVPASAAVHVRPRTRWGWYSPGPMSRPVDIPGEPATEPAAGPAAWGSLPSQPG